MTGEWKLYFKKDFDRKGSEAEVLYSCSGSDYSHDIDEVTGRLCELASREWDIDDGDKMVVIDPRGVAYTAEVVEERVIRADWVREYKTGDAS